MNVSWQPWNSSKIYDMTYNFIDITLSVKGVVLVFCAVFMTMLYFDFKMFQGLKKQTNKTRQTNIINNK